MPQLAHLAKLAAGGHQLQPELPKAGRGLVQELEGRLLVQQRRTRVVRERQCRSLRREHETQRHDTRKLSYQTPMTMTMTMSRTDLQSERSLTRRGGGEQLGQEHARSDGVRPVLGAPVAVPCRLQILLHLQDSRVVSCCVVLCRVVWRVCVCGVCVCVCVVVKLSPQRLLGECDGRLTSRRGPLGVGSDMSVARPIISCAAA
jgi:hypothetical protein